MSAPPRTFQFTFVSGTDRHRWLKNAVLSLGGCLATLAYVAFQRRRRSRRLPDGRASSLGDALESRAAVDRLLQMAFGSPEEVAPLQEATLKAALQFYERLVLLTERHCAALRDFTGEMTEPVALDLGCGVGAATFELALAFPNVLGVDASQACINAAKTLKARGWMRYSAVQEGDLTCDRTASVNPDVDRTRVAFLHANLEALPANLPAPFDAVLAANVLCRLHDPAAFLRRLPSLVRHGGVAVLASPYDWREECTPRSKWLGGFKNQQGKEVWTRAALEAALASDFELVDEAELPFVFRDHVRRFQYGVSQVTVWVRR